MMHITLPPALAIFLLGTGATLPAQVPHLRIEQTKMELRDKSSMAVEQGSFEVPEDRAIKSSRKIRLGFVRLKSTSANPGPPIVYLAGGPGGSGTGTFEGARQPIFVALRQVADVIIFDQRGTGLSNHIEPCQSRVRPDPAEVLSEASMTRDFSAALAYCLPKWKAAGVSVGGYTTLSSADDLEDLRKALGVRQIDLWGISYGSHLAFAAMRRYPASIRRVALASVEGMDQTVKRPDRTEAALLRIDQAVGGNLVDRIRRVHARFDAEPQTLSGKAEDGTSFSFRTDSFALRRFAGFLPKNPDGIPTLANGYAALDAGKGESVAPLIYSFFFGGPLTLSGMPELMDIASGISPSRARRVDRDSPQSLLGRATNFPMPQMAGAVPGLDLGEGYRREIRSSHPTLVLSGDLDVRTPLEEQAEALAGFSNLHQIIVRNGGHDLFEAHPAVPQLLIDFFMGKPVTTRLIELPKPRAGA